MIRELSSVLGSTNSPRQRLCTMLSCCLFALKCLHNTEKLGEHERWVFQSLVAGMKTGLLRTLGPKRVVGLGGLLECGCCGSVGSDLPGIRHRNRLWLALSCSAPQPVQ